MENIAIDVFKSLATQGPLVGFLFYLYYEGRTSSRLQNDKIDALQKELRDNQEKYLNKSFDQQAQTNAILAALKDAFKG